MSSSYIPARDADFALWSANFSALISATPATYGLTAGDATTIAAANASFQAAYLLVTSPTTKTAATVQAKNVAKATTLATERPYAQRIAANAGVSSSLKIALGLNPRTNPPTPVTAPTTNPILSIPSMINLGHILRYRDSLASPSVKSKPAGAIALELYGMTSATAVTDPTTLPFLGLQTKSPFTELWDSGAAGKLAYYAGRWVTRRGLTGPWSPIISMTVPG